MPISEVIFTKLGGNADFVNGKIDFSYKVGPVLLKKTGVFKLADYPEYSGTFMCPITFKKIRTS